jgi:hypothetical protein
MVGNVAVSACERRESDKQTAAKRCAETLPTRRRGHLARRDVRTETARLGDGV